MLSDFQCIGTDELILDTADVGREILDEGGNTIALLTSELGIFNGLDMLRLSPKGQFRFEAPRERSH